MFGRLPRLLLLRARRGLSTQIIRRRRRPQLTNSTPSNNATIPTDSLTGTVSRVVYHSPTTGYTVLRVGSQTVTSPSCVQSPTVGQHIECKGSWTSHVKYGPQFHADSLTMSTPSNLSDTKAIANYLGNGLISGIGPALARRIVAEFGADTLDVIENQPRQLLKVEGIGESRLDSMTKSWKAHHRMKETLLFLQQHGVPPPLALRLHRQFGDAVVQVLKENPYKLASDMHGIGFTMADRLATKLNVPVFAPERIQSAILHVLHSGTSFGHCFIPFDQLAKQAVQLLRTDDFIPDPQVIKTHLDILQEQHAVKLDTDDNHASIVYSPALFAAEINVAKRIDEFCDPRRQVLRQKYSDVTVNQVSAWLEELEEHMPMSTTLSSEQRIAVEAAALEGFVIITGGPGVGKTFTLQAIVKLWRELGMTPLLVSPTGRGAHKLSEVTGHPAQTIHRALDYDVRSQSFRRNDRARLKCDAVIVDEASMLDLPLLGSLLAAVPPSARIVLVGDVDQLPSVGPGNVLHDLLDSKRIQSVHLTQIFRQAQMSDIVVNAHRINRGEVPRMPVYDPWSGEPPTSDCVRVDLSAGRKPDEVVQQLVQSVLPGLGYNIQTQLQIVTPMQKGSLGAISLNQAMQQHIHKAPSSFKFQVGDRVIQLVNNYDKEVFNGDIGIVQQVDNEAGTIDIQFQDHDGLVCTYDARDRDEITLAWAITVHKSQGNEYDIVIVCMDMQHYPMLSRHLLYTAVTRAKHLCIVLGSQKALAVAAKSTAHAAHERHTRLSYRLGDSKCELYTANSSIDSVFGSTEHSPSTNTTVQTDSPIAATAVPSPSPSSPPQQPPPPSTSSTSPPTAGSLFGVK
jgi:exodeoxyribonuclease V alpha subunit